MGTKCHFNFLSAAIVLLFFTSAHATVIDQSLPDAAQEAHARALFHELKCVVCEGQSLADSDAMLAVEMRTHIRGMVTAQKSDAEILDYFRARSGEKILMTPPLEKTTLLLWAAPLLLLSIGGVFVWRVTCKGNPQ